MTHKRIRFGSDARERMLRGATAITDALRVTLGPNGPAASASTPQRVATWT
jgi:chaperonin GroEL (HSP60 family)